MYQRKLDRLSKQAIAAVRELLAVPVAPGVDGMHVEIFLDEYGGAPSVWAYWRGPNNKVDRSDTTLFPGRSVELSLGLESLSEVDARYFADPEEFPGTELAVSLLSRWLAECWWKAGGWTYPVPASLEIHDFGTTSWVLSEGST